MSNSLERKAESTEEKVEDNFWSGFSFEHPLVKVFGFGVGDVMSLALLFNSGGSLAAFAFGAFTAFSLALIYSVVLTFIEYRRKQNVGVISVIPQNIKPIKKVEQVETIQANEQIQLRISEEKPLEEPTFTEGFDEVRFTFGTNSLGYQIKDSPRKIQIIVADNPIFFYVEDEKPYADLIIYKIHAHPAVKLEHNQVLNKPDNWEMNSDKTALEIVNEKKKPVFQLYYKTPSHLVINGFFDINGIIVLAYNERTLINTSKDTPNPLIPIFKYPAAEYQGERVKY